MQHLHFGRNRSLVLVLRTCNIILGITVRYFHGRTKHFVLRAFFGETSYFVCYYFVWRAGVCFSPSECVCPGFWCCAQCRCMCQRVTTSLVLVEKRDLHKSTLLEMDGWLCMRTDQPKPCAIEFAVATGEANGVEADARRPRSPRPPAADSIGLDSLMKFLCCAFLRERRHDVTRGTDWRRSHLVFLSLW